jgi:hypothetical protein
MYGRVINTLIINTLYLTITLHISRKSLST